MIHGINLDTSFRDLHIKYEGPQGPSTLLEGSD